MSTANEDRRQLIQLLGVVESMAQRIARTTLQARAARAADSDHLAAPETEEDLRVEPAALYQLHATRTTNVAAVRID